MTFRGFEERYQILISDKVYYFARISTRSHSVQINYRGQRKETVGTTSAFLSAVTIAKVAPERISEIL